MSDTLFDVEAAEKPSAARRRALRQTEVTSSSYHPLTLTLNIGARGVADGLACLRDSVPDAMCAVIHLAYLNPQDNRTICAGGDWAYSIRRDGLHYELEDDWWCVARIRGERWGMDRTPAHRITWAELTELVGDDPRRAQLIGWSESLTEPAWQERLRPHELWPNPGWWHPDYIRNDHERPGWDQRITAWRTLQAILTDAMEGASA